MFRVGSAFLILILAPPLALAQQRPVSVRGRVVAAENGVPLRRARITLERRDPRILAVLTDEEGRFTIAQPDAGPSKLVVTKGGYALATIDVPRVDEKTVSARELEIRLVRSAAISGHVFDRSGAPATGAPVVARRVETGPSDPNPSTRFEAEADDLGEYRLFGLPAGRYSVTAERAGSRPLTARLTDAGVWVTTPPGGARPTAEPAAEPSGPAQILEIRRGDEQGDVNFIVDVALPSSAFELPRPPSLPRGRSVIRGWMLPSSGERITQMSVTLKGRGLSWMRITDATGRFIFDGLPSGDYTLEAPGDVTARYGQERDIRAGEVIRVRDSTSAGDAGVASIRDSAVTGSLVDEFGEPFQGIIVQALQLRYASGQRVATPVGAGRRTDDRGRYRLFRLPPGSYFVAASPEAAGSESDRAGSYRYPPVYYPGTPSIDGAQAMQVDPDRDASGVDLAVSSSLAARVSGVAIGEDGNALIGSVRLLVSRRSRATALEPRSVPIGAGGTFELIDVPPGEYVLQAFGDARFGNPSEFGAGYVSVADGDPPPQTIRASPGATLEGRIIIEGAREPTIFDFRLAPLQLDLDLGPATDLSTLSGPVLQSDGTFYQKRLYGPTRFVLATAPEGWYLKSITVGGAEITEGYFDFGTGSATFDGAEIVLSRAGATVSGAVSDVRAVSDRRYSVVVFAVDRRRWFAGSGHLKYARARPDGSFQVHSLPPGDYWVVAVDSTLGLGDWQNQEVLESLVSQATRLTLGEGETSSTRLRVIRR